MNTKKPKPLKRPHIHFNDITMLDKLQDITQNIFDGRNETAHKADLSTKALQTYDSQKQQWKTIATDIDDKVQDKQWKDVYEGKKSAYKSTKKNGQVLAKSFDLASCSSGNLMGKER